MENEKLAQTISAMVPYGLQVMIGNIIENVDCFGYTNGIGTRKLFVKWGLNGDYIEKCKPVLHPISKLTEGVLDGGLIPIVELLKMRHPLPEDKNSRYAIIEIEPEGFPRAYYKYNACNELKIFPNNLECTPNWIVEQLKKWKFNVYGLDQGEFIELQLMQSNI